MAFSSPIVTLEWQQNNVILKRGTSALVIDAKDVLELRTLKEKTIFEDYFRGTALKNREAKRVFKSWERKDEGLVSKLFSELML